MTKILKLGNEMREISIDHSSPGAIPAHADENFQNALFEAADRLKGAKYLIISAIEELDFEDPDDKRRIDKLQTELARLNTASARLRILAAGGDYR